MNEKNNIVDVKPVDGNLQVTVEEAKRLLKEHHNKVSNGDIDSFVCLKDINKIYPNGVQAVYDFNIDIKENDFIVLVGPSGCGKSTTLRMIAGLEDITSGYLYIDKVLSNYLSSKDRDISMVFQSYALYPQMSVYENIAFPLRARKYRKIKKADVVEGIDQVVKALEDVELVKVAIVEANDVAKGGNAFRAYVSTKLGVNDFASKFIVDNKEVIFSGDVKALLDNVKALRVEEVNKVTANGNTINENYEILNNGEVIEYEAKLTESEIREKVFDAARILDLGPYLDRRPKELSGGQMQRVALGRAIVRNAKLFLMDEPLSNLDAKLRVQMRSEIVRIHEQIGATTIYVTHDQTEAMTMATKIAVMSKGWVQQIGTPQEIYNNPKNIFVATFIGAPAMNIVDGTYDNGVVKFDDGYSIKLSSEHVASHDKFYNEKIADLKRMLAMDDFVKMHALLVYDDIVKNHADRLDEFKNIVNDIKDVYGEVIRNALAQYDASKDEKVLHSIRKDLLTFTKISSTDLGKLHNAQVFKKDAKVEDKTMHYQKRKPKVKKQKNANLNSTNVEFINNLYEVATDLLAKYEEAVKGVHPVRFGIRPENIHLNNECNVENKSEILTVKSDIVELMGSELLIHSKWNEANFISKISTGTLVKPHIDVELALDLDKILLFDAYCGDTIK
jgi:multiple sugar transport system ATP-binding protein